MSITQLVVLIFSLGARILEEFFSARSRARELNEAFNFDKEKFLSIADAAILRMRTEAKKENDSVQRNDDAVDREINRKD